MLREVDFTAGPDIGMCPEGCAFGDVETLPHVDP